MRPLFIVFGLALALSAGSAAVAAPSGKPDRYAVRTQIFWHAADQLWTGLAPTQVCGPRMLDVVMTAPPYESPIRRASFERRGELVAELRTPLRGNNAVIGNVRACANEAADLTTLPYLLTGQAQPWATFRGAFQACLVRTKTAKHVGSMTLWVDNSCNW